MASDNRIHMPAGFGGLMHYSEEYASKIMLKPVHIVGLVVLIILIRIVLPLIF